MNIPSAIQERLAKLSSACGVALRVVRFWDNEFRPGWHCRFHGVAHESPLLRLEVAGSLAIELSDGRDDEVDLFVFVNGTRVGPMDAPAHYLHQVGAGPVGWADLDEGFMVQKTLSSITKSDG